MSTKKLVVLSVFFVIAGFFLSGYIFAEEGRTTPGMGEIEKLKQEQKALLEKVAELEAVINQKPEEKSEDEPPVVPEKSVVLVAYVKDEHSSVNTRADAGTNYPIVEKVSQKSPMVVLETKDDWYRVKLESGNIAWVASWVVRVQEE